MKKILMTSGIVVLIVASIIVAGVKKSHPTTTNETVKIGAVMGLTGDAAAWGEMSLKGSQMAVEELNAKGGINGKKIELVVEDMKSASPGSIAAVQKVVAVDKVSAIVGPSWLDVYQGAATVVAGKDIPLISPDAGIEAVNVPKVNPNAFSTWYRSQPKAELLMTYLSSIGVKRLALVHQNDSYYVDLGKRLETEAQKHGITITEHALVNTGEGDLRTLVTKLKADKPDMVFVALYDQKSTDSFFKNRAQIAPDLKIASDEFGQDYVESPTHSKEINGMYFFSATRQDNSFEKRFKEKYENLTPKFGASNGYDAIMIAAEALKNSPNDLLGYIKKTEFTTVTFGKMRFDSINGVDTHNETYAMKQFKDGTVTILK